MKPLNRNTKKMPHSGIREIVNIAVAMPEVCHLEIGQPSFNTPPHISEAAFAAAREGHTGYTESAGLLSLRELLVEKLDKVNGISTSPDNIIVTVGAVGGIVGALLALCEPGDEILVPDPAWPNYGMIAQCIGGEIRSYPCLPEHGFLPDLQALEALVTEQTKVLVLNSPGNPSGAVFPAETVRALVALAREHDLWIIGDEVYDQLVYEGEHVSPSTFDQDGRTVSVFSFSKTYAMTGWRIGYVVAPSEVAEQIQKLQEPFVSCAPSISQKAAEAALRGPQDCVENMRKSYQRRRNLVVDTLKDYGWHTYTPQGAFYVLVDVSETGMDSRSFALSLLQKMKVAVAPGQAFGEVAHNHVRVSLAAEEDALVEGLGRMRQFIENNAQD